MKRYIRASLSESTPDWLRRRITSRNYYNQFKSALLKKYNIALDKATYTDTPTSSSDIPIYLLNTDYGTIPYCPGANDDETTFINGRQRKLGSIAKSKLSEMAEDVVYIDLNNSENVAPKRSRYQDPRYTYRYNPEGKYAGQYRKTKWNRDTGEDEPAGWSEKGMTPSNESRARDKSGYKIPSPEDRLYDYYTRYPEKLTNKVDQLYDKLIATRQLLSEADFNVPSPSYRYRSEEPNVDYGKAYRRFADAVDDYRQLLTQLKDFNDSLDGYELSSFTRTVRNISTRVDDILSILNGENVW